MSKKKQEKSGNKQEKYDLLQTFYWYTITYGSGLEFQKSSATKSIHFSHLKDEKFLCNYSSAHCDFTDFF